MVTEGVGVGLLGLGLSAGVLSPLLIIVMVGCDGVSHSSVGLLSVA